MARGKIGLRDTVKDEEIVRLGEVRNEPNYIFPDGIYGISGGYGDYSLVKKRVALRTGNEEDGINNGKVIEYTTYEDVPCYVSTIQGIFESYARIINLTELKKKKMCNDIGEIVNIHKNTQEMVSEALKGYDKHLNKNQREACNLIDTIEMLKKYITEQETTIEKYKKYNVDIDRMYAEIKDKRKIIVDVDKPKKHKHVEEE